MLHNGMSDSVHNLQLVNVAYWIDSFAIFAAFGYVSLTHRGVQLLKMKNFEQCKWMLPQRL